MLTDADIAAAELRDRPYKLAAGRNLYVLVKPTGLKSFRWKFHFRGMEKLLTLGRHPDFSIEEIRARVVAARESLKAGLDPTFRRDAPCLWTLAHLADIPPPLLHSVVYFAQIATGHIKIGVTINVEHRMAAFQHCHAEPVVLLATMPGGHSHEQMLHRIFARDRDHGEWFTPTPELLGFIETLKATTCR